MADETSRGRSWSSAVRAPELIAQYARAGQWHRLRHFLVSLPLFRLRGRRWLQAAGGPAVSVVIAARNAAATLAETLACLAAQEVTAWEAVIVDDGSTDATPAIVAEAAARDPRIRTLRHEQGRGVSAARNAGVAVARAP